MAGRSQAGRRGGHGMITDHVIWNASCPVAVVPIGVGLGPPA